MIMFDKCLRYLKNKFFDFLSCCYVVTLNVFVLFYSPLESCSSELPPKTKTSSQNILQKLKLKNSKNVKDCLYDFFKSGTSTLMCCRF